MRENGWLEIIGGPWTGKWFWGGCSYERVKVITLRGGYYRVWGNGAEMHLAWVRT